MSIQKCLPEDLKFMPNIRNMVFKVMPKLVYEATREYNKEKKAYDEMVQEAENEAKKIDVDGSKASNAEEYLYH